MAENLKDMDIPDSVRDIGDSALRGCRSLTKIQIPSKIKSIGEWAFCGCGFVELTIPETIKVIKKGMLASLFDIRICKSLKSIKFSSNLDQIDVCAFSGCESLTEIVFPRKLTLIGEWAFRSCSSLTTVEIPLSSTDLKIRYGAFENCDNLQKIILKRYSPDKIKVFSESFSDKVMNSCTLVVPGESIEAYKKHEVFGKFKNIIAL